MIKRLKHNINLYESNKDVEFISRGDKFIFNKPVLAPNFDWENPEPYVLPEIIKVDKLTANIIDCPTLPKEYIHPKKFEYEELNVGKLKTNIIDCKCLKITNNLEIGQNIFVHNKIYKKGAVTKVLKPIQPIDIINNNILKVEQNIILPTFSKFIIYMKFKKKGLYFRFHIYNISDEIINIKDNENFILQGRKTIPPKTINEYYLNIMKNRCDLIQLSTFTH